MFARQLHNPLLLVLPVTAAVLRAVSDLTGALTIGAIVAMSVGLSFFWSTLLASV